MDAGQWMKNGDWKNINIYNASKAEMIKAVNAAGYTDPLKFITEHPLK